MALMNYLEAEDDGHGPVPMEVGAMKGKKRDKSKKGYGKGKYGKSFRKVRQKTTSTARTPSTAEAVEKEKKKERKAKEKDKEKTRSQHQIRVSRATAGHVASGSTRRASVGKVTCKPWRKFRVLPRVQWRRVQRPHLRLRRQQRPFKRSMTRMNQYGSSA